MHVDLRHIRREEVSRMRLTQPFELRLMLIMLALSPLQFCYQILIVAFLLQS